MKTEQRHVVLPVTADPGSSHLEDGGFAPPRSMCLTSLRENNMKTTNENRNHILPIITLVTPEKVLAHISAKTLAAADAKRLAAASAPSSLPAAGAQAVASSSVTKLGANVTAPALPVAAPPFAPSAHTVCSHRLSTPAVTPSVHTGCHTVCSTPLRAGGGRAARSLQRAPGGSYTVWALFTPSMHTFSSQVASLDAMRIALTDPDEFVRRLGAASGPAARAFLMQQLRPKLEPCFERQGVEWEDALPTSNRSMMMMTPLCRHDAS